MKKISRREFLKTSAGAVGAVACCSAGLGPLGCEYAWAADPGGPNAMLVLLNQSGGNDGINSFAVPYTLNRYFDRRPGIAHDPADVLQMASGIGLHPSLTTLKRLFDEGDATVVQSCGEPTGTRSHNAAQNIHSRGATGTENTGWIGRLVSAHMSGIEFNTLGVGVGNRIDFNSTTSQNRPIVLNNLGSFNMDSIPGKDSDSVDRDYRVEVARSLLTLRSSNSRESAVIDSVSSMYSSLDRISQANGQGTAGAYPGSVGNFFRDVAKVARFGLGTKVMYGAVGGWDTHSNQLTGHVNRLGNIDQALAALETDLKAAGRWESTTIIIFTEFGRNTFENASGGTDHGNGYPMVVVGGSVRGGGVYGPVPQNSDIDERWLTSEVDFRNVFAEAIAWLGYDPAQVFTQNYTQENLNLFA